MKITRFSSLLEPARILPLLSPLLWLTLASPVAATSLQLDFTVPASFNESNRQPVLQWNAEPAKTYLVQSATNLSPATVWKIEEAVRATNTGPIRWTAPESLRIQKYYRLLLPGPELFSVEPAFVNSSDPRALLYLSGQCLPTNGSVRINGQTFNIISADPNGSWIALSLNGLPPGTPILGFITVLDNTSNVVATLPVQSPLYYGTELTQEQLQGPPDEPPASPDTHIVEEIEFVVEKVERARTAKPAGVKPNKDYATDPYVETSQRKKGYDYYQAQSQLNSASLQTNPYFHQNQNAGEMPDRAARAAGQVSPSKDYATDPYVETSQRTYISKKGYDYYQCKSDLSVALGSGELQYESTDLAVAGRGLSFAWTCTYRSRTGPTTPQGAGWDFSYNVSLTQQPDGTMLLRPGNCRADAFYPDGTNGWTRDEYFVEIRDLNSDGMPDVLFPDTGRWLFKPSGLPEAGKLWKIIDRAGNTMTLNYDFTGRLTTIVDTLDRTNTVAYNPVGQIESVTDFSGRSVRYEYDTQGNLAASISPPVTGTPTGNDFPGGQTNRFNYTKGFLDDRLNHNLTSIIDGKGQVTMEAVYHASSTPASLDFDTVTSLLRGVDKKDIWRGIVIARPSNSFATVQTIVNDYVGNVVECLLDSRLRCVTRREFTGRADPKIPTTDTDNRPKNKLRVDDPDWFETRWEWNADSLCTREIRANGGSTEVSHQRAQDHNSSRSNKTASRRHDGDVRVLRERASSPVDTDGDGSPDSTELSWHFEYDPRFGSSGACRGKKLYVGNLPFRVHSVDARGNEATSQYDNSGNCTKSIKQGHYAVSNFHIEVDGGFNGYGQLTVLTNAADANGYRRVDTFSYYTSGPQLGMVEVMMASALAGGLALTTAFEYDPRGNITHITDPRGNDMFFTYNSLDQCVQSQSPAYGGGSGQPPQRITTQYIFDANNNLVRCDIDNRDETGALNGANPQWSTRFEYDALRRLTGVVEEIAEGPGLPGRYATNHFVYNGNDDLIEDRSPMAVSGADPHNIVAFEHDERGLLFREIAAPGSPAQCTTQCDYDSLGNLGRVIDGLELDPAVTTFSYDGFCKYVAGGGKAQGIMGSKAKAWMVNNYEVHPVFGLKLAWVETVWNKQCIEKDTTVRLADMTDPMGNITTFHYDLNSNLKVVRHFAETNDAPGGVANVLLAETRLSYDGFDRCVQNVDSFFDPSTGLPIGDGRAITTLAYAPNGACTSVTDDNGHITRFNYDNAGRIASVIGPKTNVVQFTLDACGNVTGLLSTERADLGQVLQQFSTAHTYDSLNRCIASADNVGNTNRYAYDSRGNLVSRLDPRENECFSVFDGLSRCVATTNYVGKERGITINTSHVEYNTNSRETSATDSNGNTTQYAYDSINRCTAVTGADGTVCSLIWSPRSNLLRQQDANGTVITNSYDLLDRCVSRIISPGPEVVPATTFETFAYDGASRCVAASNNVSLATLAYDSLSHCVRSTQDGLACSSTFDAVGNCLSETYPGGRVVTCTYDPLDQLSSVSSGAGGQPPALLAQYSYEGSGRVGRISRSNGVDTRIQWNGLLSPANAAGEFGWLSNKRITHGIVVGNITLDQRTFLHDRSQNTLSRVRTPGPVIPGESITVGYDALDRLTNFVRAAGSTNDVTRQYALDGNGNRQVVLENSLPQNYFMDPTFPVPADFQMNHYTSTPFENQEHDENGNLIARSSTAGTTSYYFDYADRLVQVESLGGGGFVEIVASYAYDALGRRIRKTLRPGPAQTVIHYTHSAAGDVIEERVNGALTRSYVIPEVDDEVLVSFNQAGQPQYYHHDDLGNTLLLTDAAGAVLERCEYEDYGRVKFLTSDGIPTGASSSAVGNVYCWGGLQLDPETGLHNDGGDGYYEPQMGAWITSIGLPKITPKISRECHGQFRMGNNPLSGGSPQSMQKGTVKFFNEAKGFGRIAGGDRSRSVDSPLTVDSRAQDHNSSRSNKTASKIGPGGGGGGGGGGSKAQDHNSSRSNKTASKVGPGGGGGGGGGGSKAQDHNSSRSNKTASSIAPGGGSGGGGGGGWLSRVGANMDSEKHTKTGHVTLLK